MTEKRYSIVRVNYNDCPIKYKVPQKHRKIQCFPFQCDKCGLYGDTKEQLIRKVAQVLFRNAPKETYQPKYVEQREKILKVAKEIVEFLGVK